MTPERWHRTSQLYHAALARDESQRAAFLREACAGDEALRHEVASLLSQGGGESFLEAGAFAQAMKLLADGHGLSTVSRPEADRRPRARAPWWIHLCAALFLGYFGLLIFSIFNTVSVGIGIESAGANGLIVARVTAGSEAEHAGVQRGDRLVAINGRSLHTAREQRAFTASASPGEPSTWFFERSGRQFPVTVVPRRVVLLPAPRLLPNLVGLLASLIFSFVVIYSRPDDRVARLGALLLASIGCASAPIWPSGLAGTWRHLPVLVGALLWPACISSVAVGPIMFSFFAVFPRTVIHRRWIWIAALTPAAIVTAWVGAYLMLVVYQPERSLDLYQPDWFTVVGPLSFPAYFAAGIAMLVWNYRRLTDLNERRRIRLLFFGIAAAGAGLLYVVVAIVVTDLGLRSGPIFLFAGPSFVIAGLLFLALPCSFAYAIVTERLFDIRIIIRQGLQYAFARRSILLLVPALMAGLVVDLVVHAERPLIDIIQVHGWVYATLGVLAALVYRNRDAWMASLDRRFFRERYDAHQILRQVVDDVRAAAGLDTVASVVVSRMSAAFHSTFCALLVCEPHQRRFHVLAVAPDTTHVPRLTRDSKLVGLVRVLGKPIDYSSSPGLFDNELPAEDAVAVGAARVDLVAPIVTGATHQPEALLVLGTKRSEEPYAQDDRELVTSVAASLAVLLERRPEEGETDDSFVECPRCGACVGSNASRCAEDGTSLVRVNIPRVLGGRYTIHQRLGRGGMGTVYEAHDAALERRVAVKVIRDEMAGSPEMADRFRREALVAASFAHPNVVTVYDVGITDNARGYLVMELLKGATLKETLRREGHLTPSRALHVMRGVCQAIDAAHRRELVHRDLKPDNIFLTKDDIPKVLDFGIAKFVRSALDSVALTATGAPVGTLGYMSPEQIRGGAPSPSWDLWALGVVAYEMLAGRRPFADTGSVHLFAEVAGETWIRLAGGPLELPPALDSVFGRAFALDPAERPSGALVFMGSLEQAIGG